MAEKWNETKKDMHYYMQVNQSNEEKGIKKREKLKKKCGWMIKSDSGTIDAYLYYRN